MDDLQSEEASAAAHSPSRPQRKRGTDAERTGKCRRVSEDCSERDADSHLEFIGGEALPEEASKAGVSLNGRAATQRTV